MNKDWTGNTHANIATLAARNLATTERQEHDYYATDPKAIDMLLEHFVGSGKVWECAAGQGHLSKRLREITMGNGALFFDHVFATDLIQRDTPLDPTIQGGLDFLTFETFDGLLDYDIITNPPYKYSEEFIRKALSIIQDGFYVCMFLPIRYLEGKQRRKLFDEYPPYKVIISSGRMTCALNGDFENQPQSAQAYAWFI